MHAIHAHASPDSHKQSVLQQCRSNQHICFAVSVSVHPILHPLVQPGWSVLYIPKTNCFHFPYQSFEVLRRGDSKPMSDAKISSRPGHSSSFVVEQGWTGARAWWVKRSKSLNSSKTCSIRPFLCSRSARRRCFRIDLDNFALCDFDLVILRSASKAWKTSSYIVFCPGRFVAALFSCADARQQRDSNSIDDCGSCPGSACNISWYEVGHPQESSVGFQPLFSQCTPCGTFLGLLPLRYVARTALWSDPTSNKSVALDSSKHSDQSFC